MEFLCVCFVIYYQYLEMYKRSIEDPAGFWSEIASEFYWKQKWGDKVCDENFDIRKGNIKIEVIFIYFILHKSGNCVILFYFLVFDQGVSC